MRCPVCGWVDAGEYHSALHVYHDNTAVSVVWKKPLYNSGRPRVFPSFLEAAWMIGYAIMQGWAAPIKGQIIWVGKTP